MAVAHQPRHVRDRDRLPRQQLRGGHHAARAEVLLEGLVTELRVGALQLARRAGQGARQRLERQRAAVVARDQHPRQQIQPASLAEGAGAHED